MQYFKVPDSAAPSGFSVHALDDGVDRTTVFSFPPNAEPIGETEAMALVQYVVQQDPKQVIQSQIDDLLRLAGVAQEWHLDAMMAGMVALAATQGLTEVELYDVNPGYKQVKDVSEQIKALKVQL